MKIQKKIKNLLKELDNLQDSDGSFPSQSILVHKNVSDTKILRSEGLVCHTTFFTSLISGILSSFAKQNHQAQFILKKSLLFLQNVMSPTVTWNYLAQHDPAINSKVYPDDLDDTMAALIAFSLGQPEFVDANIMAKVTTLLTLLEEKTGGPYRTWIIANKEINNDEMWRNVDIVANAQTAYFLKLHNIEVPKLREYLIAVTKSGDLTSDFYHHSAVILYFLTRFFTTTAPPELSNRLRKEFEAAHIQEHSTEMLLLAISLIRTETFTAKDWKAVARILDRKNKSNNSKKEFRFFIEEKKLDDSTKQANCVAMEIALQMEFWQLAKDLDLGQTKTIKLNLNNKDKDNELNSNKYITEIVFDETLKYLGPNNNTIQSDFQTLKNSLIENETTCCLISLPQKIFNNLKIYKTTKLEIRMLCRASLCGILAYRIIDDIFDDGAKRDLLPLATALLRMMTEIFHTLWPAEQYSLCNKLLTEIECGMSEEFNFDSLKPLNIELIKEFEKDEQVVRRSRGLAIAPLTIFLREDSTDSEIFMKLFISFLSNYIMARQINDDAHDLITDLLAGHLTNTGRATILAWSKHHPNSENLSIPESISELETIFWNECAEDTTQEILDKIDEAKQTLSAMEHIFNCNFLKSLLIPIEICAKNTLTEIKNTKKFIYAYKNLHTSNYS